MSSNEAPGGDRATEVGSFPAPSLDLESWRLAGRRAGEAHEARLRALESQERAARTARMLSSSPGEAAPVASPGRANTWQVERELELFLDFHRALSRSRAWRLIQALRRPFGRDW